MLARRLYGYLSVQAHGRASYSDRSMSVLYHLTAYLAHANNFLFNIACKHYRKTEECRVLKSSPCAICRAHGKDDLCREPPGKHMAKSWHMAKRLFVVCATGHTHSEPPDQRPHRLPPGCAVNGDRYAVMARPRLGRMRPCLPCDVFGHTTKYWLVVCHNRDTQRSADSPCAFVTHGKHETKKNHI